MTSHETFSAIREFALANPTFSPKRLAERFGLTPRQDILEAIYVVCTPFGSIILDAMKKLEAQCST